MNEAFEFTTSNVANSYKHPDLFSIWIFLRQQREIFEQCWSASTAHPKSLQRITELCSSTGQCFVTSFCLQHALWENFGASAKISRGHLENSEGIVIINDHCWLELELDYRESMIIDLTADQSGEIAWKVIFGSHKHVRERNRLMYVSHFQFEKDCSHNMGSLTASRCTLLMCKYHELEAKLHSGLVNSQRDIKRYYA